MREYVIAWEAFIVARRGHHFLEVPAIATAWQQLAFLREKPPTAKLAMPLELLQLLTAELWAIIDSEGTAYPRGQLALRDIIALNISFFGLLRRSDLYNVKWAHLQCHPQYDFVLLDVPFSKSDRPAFTLDGTQQGRGTTLAIPLKTREDHNWSADMMTWHTLTKGQGAFLPAYDAKAKKVIWDRQLTPAGVAAILRNRTAAAVARGLLPTDLLHHIASHSIRREGASYLVARGAEEWFIQH